MKKYQFSILLVLTLVLGLFLTSCNIKFHEHQVIIHEAVEATCSTEGSIKYYECEDCHKLYAEESYLREIELEDTIVPAKGHTMIEHEAVEATCTKDGSVHYYECTECDKIFEDEAGEVELSDVVVAKGHKVVEHEAKEATCTEAGNIHYFGCEACGKYFEDEECLVELQEVVIAKKPHVMTEHAAVEATCEHAGNVHYFECSSCDKYYANQEGTEEIKEVVIAQKAHVMTEHAAKEATCTEAGNVHYYECTTCEKYYADQDGKTVLEEVVIAATGHAMTEVEEVKATCGVAGNVHYFECGNCGKYFADKEGTVEIKEVVIPALVHNVVFHAAKEAQPGVPGNDAYYGCDNCNKAYADEQGTEEIDINTVLTYAYLVTNEDASTPGYYVDYRDSITFKDVNNNGTFVSQNKGMSSSSAYMDIRFTGAGVFTFTYTVSSESGWDKFNIYAQSDGEAYRQIVSGASGEVTATLTLNIAAGDYVFFQYSKDSGGNRGSDTVTLSNMVFVTGEKYEKSVLTFESNGGSAVEAITKFNNVAIDEPVAPVKDGYFFEAWYTDEALTQEFDFAKGLNGNTTVYAKYVKGVTITYAQTGDTTVEAVLVRPNTAFVAPDVIPTSATQYFKGWFADADCTIPFDFETGVAADTTVYAGWRNPVVVTFESNGGSAVENVSTDINVEITLPAAPTKAGYSFDGWFVDEACTTEFDPTTGITENTTVYAKWLVVYTVTYMNGEQVVGTEEVIEGTPYFINVPEGFVEIVEGWFVDADFTTEYVAGTAINENTTLYAKVKTFAPAGVLESMNNGADGSYEWIYNAETETFESSNAGVSSSKSILELVYAKASFTAFDYLVNSESNYDYLVIYVNGSEVYKSKSSGNNGIDITGSFAHTFNAGDVLRVVYQKDSSGNRGDDHGVLSNFVIYDGVPGVQITLDFNDANVENVTVDAELNAVVSSIEELVTLAPADTDARHFGGWYYDAEFTNPVNNTDTLLASATLYAKYLYPATISFDTDGAAAIDPIQVWTGVAIENMPENPTKDGYIFRYWLDENADPFNPENGISGSVTLYAYFETLPVGSTKEEALEIQLENGSFVASDLRTNEEFQNFYAVFTPTVTDYYYFKFDSNFVTVEGGSVSSNSYRRFTIEDANGNVVLSKTSDDSRVELEAGVTYYVIYNLAYSSYKAWGTFKAEVYQYNNDFAATESIAYEFGTTVELPGGSFKARAHTLVYKYDCAQTGVYALKLATSAWANVKVYSDVELTNQIATKNCSATTVVVDLPATQGETYYIVLSHNWTSTELLTKTMSFAVNEYPQGYAVNNPFTYTIGEEMNLAFTQGANVYYQVNVQETGTYKLSILSISDSNSKTIEVYTADMATKVATLAGTAACEYYIENLEAGNYIIKAYNTSSNYNTSFTAKFELVGAGDYWTTAETLTLAANMTLEAAGIHYYQFTTVEQLWHFFTADSGKVEVYDASRKLVGQTGVQLAADTTYFLVVTADAASVNVTFNSLVEYADGKSPAGAFTYNAETANLSLVQANYTTYFKFTVAESGTYRIFTNNNGSLDTRGYLYDNVACSTQLKYNDDAGSSNTYVGYRYDFYFECQLEAGVEYYLKVTYNVYASNTATSLTLNIQNTAN